jgi:hypothetical protein
MMRVTSCVRRAQRGTNVRDFWDAGIYAQRVGNPFARRHKFYRKVATIYRVFCNKGARLSARAKD